MRLLIVDDNQPLAELTAALLQLIDDGPKRIDAITLVGDLESALGVLPQHDVVLCDGHFPISRDSGLIGEEWHSVRREARRLGIHFVLFSGCMHTVDDARDSYVPAISKPASIETIYAALTERRPDVQHYVPVTVEQGENPRISMWEARDEADTGKLLPRG